MSGERTRALVVLGAGADQLPLIRAARALGLFVTAFDRDPAAPGLALADEGIAVSSHDALAVCAALEERRRGRPEIAGVLTMGSDVPHVVAAVAARLGTPHVPLETARLATDKLAMKERFRQRDVPIPWFREVGEAAEVRRLVAGRGRLVMKPTDRSGARGVFVVDGSSDAGELFERSRAVSYAGRVMVEELLEGPQISTETVLWRGRAVTPGFADRNYELLERFRPRIIENGGWVPSLLSPGERRAVERVAEDAARALGITDGIAKGDLVLTPDGPRVIEVAARLSGGDFASGLVPLGTGVDYVTAAIRIAIGEDPDLDSLAPRFHRAVANRYLFPAPGRLVAVEGEAEVRSWPWVEKLELCHRPGDLVPPVESHASRFGVFVVTGPDRATVQERVDRVYATLRVVTEPVPAAGS